MSVNFTENDNENIHYLVKAKKILGTNEWLPLLDEIYRQKNLAYMKNNMSEVQKYLHLGHLIARAMPYELYRQSAWWKDLRYTLFNQEPNCKVCKRDGYDMHHTRYDTLFKEIVDDDVITLCRRCHGTFHHHYKVPGYFELKRLGLQ